MTGKEKKDRSGDCRWFRIRLREMVSGTLSEADRRVAEDHLFRCSECSEEWTRRVGEFPDLTGCVMDRIGADPCRRVMDVLAEDDDSRSGLDYDLFSQHLDHCGSCREVAAVVSRLQFDLPGMLDMEPDAGFLEGVVAATAPPSGGALSWSYVREVCDGLARRPRIAMEAAYIVSLLFFIVFGVGHLPFERIGLTQEVPTAIAGTLSDFNTHLDQQLGSIGGDFYGVVSHSMVSASRGYQRTLRDVADLEIRAVAVTELAGAVVSRLPHSISKQKSNDQHHIPDQGG